MSTKIIKTITTIKNKPIYPYLVFTATFLLILSLSRLGFALWQAPRLNASDGWLPVLLQGVRVDIASIFLFLFIPLVFSSFRSEAGWLNKLGNHLTKIWLTLVGIIFVFMELATPAFIQEYNIRPNRLFIEYLIYPKEVFGMLLKSHLPEIINSSILTLLAGWLTWRFIASKVDNVTFYPLKWRLPIAIALLFLSVLGVRSSLGHRPMNPAMVYFTNDPLVNSLTLNSTYSVLWAAKQMNSEESGNFLYGELTEQEIIDGARQFKHIENQPVSNKALPTYSSSPPIHQGQPKNLVIILEESLGARFVGSLGGLPLTPNIDELSQQGLNFTKMFATGTRSVRGIEAVITGFTPTPDRAVVKLDKSQHNFFTLADLLSRHDYHTEFIYGGEAHFDNMKSFFLGNGFQHITEEKDYLHPNYVGSWGVSDEDLFNKAHQVFNDLALKNQPFFSLVFSSSNHDPFEYPDDRITPYDKKKFTRNNAIKYADWALGDFFKKAKTSKYWDNTVFLVVADHDARVLGADMVPFKSFHIPAFILGKDILPRTENRMVSQIDLPPTMLSLIGIENASPMLGQDLTRLSDDYMGRALMQYGQNFALVENNLATVLQPDKDAIACRLNENDFSSRIIGTADPAETKKALAISLWGSLSYSKQMYRLPTLN